MPQVKHFPLPDVGEGLTEAEILGWHVQPGDTVTVNQIIVEIETAKAAVELPCPYAGVVTEVLAQVGETVNVGSPIIAIDVDPSGSAPAGPSTSGAAGAVLTEQGATARVQPTNGTPSTVGGRIPTLVGYGPRSEGGKRRPRKDSTAGTGSGGAVGHTVAEATSATAGVRVTQASPVAPAVPEAQGGYVPLAKPPVRKLAKELGIDLRTLAGSQQHGVITREDVEQAARGAAGPVSAVAESLYTAKAGSRERRVPIRGVRKATAQAVSDSAFTAPHVTEFLQVDVTPMMELRARLRETPAFRDVKLTPLAFVAKAVCLAARRTPDVNASWDEAAGEIVYKDYVHLGIAAATPRGLVVPKIRDADQMSLRELAEALAQLTEVARAGKTTPAEMLNGTFTITNVGVFGVDTGTPILNPGESAILALGAIRDMPWVVNGQIVPRKICQLALSFDHRVVDGLQGSTFLADLGALLADPGMAITY